MKKLPVVLWILILVLSPCLWGDEPLQSNDPDQNSGSGLPPQNQNEGFSIHRVQQGDTLWWIASKTLGDPAQWPKIWELNKDTIKNPHWIYPGQEIRLGPGKGVPDSTSFQPALQENPPEETPSSGEVPQENQPIVQVSSSSQPLSEEVGTLSSLDKKRVGSGRITKTMDDKIILEPGDEVIVKLKGSQALPAGTLLTVYRNTPYLLDKEGEMMEEEEEEVEVLGTLQILRSLGLHKARGKIINSTGVIEEGDSVMLSESFKGGTR